MDLKQENRFAWNSGEVAVLIPSIDLMGGKIVQLVQGEKKALEFDNFDEWIRRFSSYPLVQLIDLDAAMGTGNNRAARAAIARQLPCQVGGGIRSLEAARRCWIRGAAGDCGFILVRRWQMEARFAEDLAAELAQID